MVESTDNYEHFLYTHQKDISSADAVAWAFTSPSKYELFPYKLPELQPNEIRGKLLYTGLCLSDCNHVRGKWGNVPYPVAPGHEVIAVVTALGSEVKDFQIGDKVGFCPLRDYCGNCDVCKLGRDNLCEEVDFKFLYGFHFGGYSTHIQQPDRYAFKISDTLPEDKIAPLLCAGATVYSPLVRVRKEGDVVGVVGIGGLGHLAVMYASKMGHKVVAFTTNLSNKNFIEELGASVVVDVNDKKEMGNWNGKINVLINTSPSNQGIEDIIKLIAPTGWLCQVGLPDIKDKLTFHPFMLTTREINITGGLVGSRKDISDMLEFSDKHQIYPLVEEFSFEDFPKAFDKLENGKPKFRCVLNVKDFSEKNGLFI